MLWRLGKGRFEINQLLFADDTALVADSEKLCRLASEFGRVCGRRKLRVNCGARGMVMGVEEECFEYRKS